MAEFKVEFKDNSIAVINAIKEIAPAVLEEVCGELKSQTQRNTRVDSSETKGKWAHIVTSKGTRYEGVVGNPMQNAIWEEFGTGEHALDGKGRKGGYWVFVKGSSGSKSKSGKTYTQKKAKQVVAMMRSKGLDAYYTNGKKPSRAFYKAYTSLKNKLIKRIQDAFKGGLS